MQLCGVNSLVADSENVQWFGVSGDLPFANQAFAKKLNLDFPLLSDPTLSSCARYVGLCNFGDFLADAGISSALRGVQTSNRGCVVLDENGDVVYAFSGEGHPGLQPKLADIRKAIGM